MLRILLRIIMRKVKLLMVIIFTKIIYIDFRNHNKSSFFPRGSIFVLTILRHKMDAQQGFLAFPFVLAIVRTNYPSVTFDAFKVRKSIVKALYPN